LFDRAGSSHRIAARGEGNRSGLDVSWVEVICEGVESQAIVPVDGYFELDFGGCEVECSGVYYEPIVHIMFVGEIGKGGGDGRPVFGELLLLVLKEGRSGGREEGLKFGIPEEGH
jgi:hypothetical protein